MSVFKRTAKELKNIYIYKPKKEHSHFTACEHHKFHLSFSHTENNYSSIYLTSSLGLKLAFLVTANYLLL